MLIREGVRVWGTARDASRLAHFLPEGTTVATTQFVPVVMDLREGAAAEAVFHHAETEASGFDLVINNAGYGVFGEFAPADFSVWQEQLEVMLLNTARLSHAALRGMLDRNRGALVNVSSLAAEFPLPFQSAYNIAKAGLTALSESLMMELDKTGIVILDVRPGDYRTDFEGSVRRVSADPNPRMIRAWHAFEKMMQTGPHPAHAAEALRRALLRNRSGTVRTGRFFQAVVAPFLARLGSLPLRRRIQSSYYDV